MSVPTSIDSGLGGGTTVAGGGAYAAGAAGAPDWAVLALVLFTLVFMGLLVYRLSLRGMQAVRK